MFAYNKVTLTFITEMLLVAVLIISLIISIKRRKKIKELRFFPFYLGYFLFVFLCGDICYFIAFKYDQKPIALAITSYTDYSSTLIEIIIFLHFFYSIIYNDIVKKTVPIIAVCFCALFFWALLSESFFPDGITESTQSRVYTIEAAILMSYSTYCLIEIIRNKDFEWTFKLAEILLHDTHDLIHKAVGWMMREAGKKDVAPLLTFLDKHADVMQSWSFLWWQRR